MSVSAGIHVHTHKHVEQFLYVYMHTYILNHRYEIKMFLISFNRLNSLPDSSDLNWSRKTQNNIGRKLFESHVSILDIKFSFLIYPILLSPQRTLQERGWTGLDVKQILFSSTFAKFRSHWPKKDLPKLWSKPRWEDASVLYFCQVLYIFYHTESSQKFSGVCVILFHKG